MRKLVRMRYSSFISLDPDAMLPFVYATFRANSVYDPDQSGTGHQAYGYDQWSTFYPTWAVIGSKITVKFLSTGGSVTTPAIVGVATDNLDTPPSSWDQETILEQPGVSWRMLPSVGISNPLTITARYSAKKWWGISRLADNDELWGGTNNNPAYQTYFNIYCAAADGGTNLPAFYGMVTIDYLVLMRNPNMLDRS